jgi:hypothetical protein
MADEIDLLSQPFMDWESVTKGATYNGSDNKSRLDLFDNWSAYAKDYSAKQLAEAPEDKKLETQEIADSVNGFIEEQSNFLKNKYDLGHRISKMETSAEVIDALRDPDKLRAEGFSDEVIFGLRKSAESIFAPVMARSQADTLSEDEAGKALWEDPGYLDAATSFAFRALPVIATAALKTVEGVTDLAGKANEINPFASDFDKDLGRSVAKKVTSAAKQGTEWINSTFPSDPRLSENTLAATEGLAQVPFNLATARLGTVPNAITNYGQLYQENVDTYVPQITEQRYKDEIRSGRASATTPFKQWESLLSAEDKKDIRAEAATKAMLVAVPQAALETLADMFLLKNAPLPDSVKSKLMSWRNARPATYMGARVVSNAFVKTASEMGSEGGQKIIGNIGGATNTGDWSFGALTKDVEPSMIGGAFGGAGAAAFMLPNTFRTERAIDWAQGIVNGQDEAAQKDIAILKAKDADIESKEYKAAYERAKAKDRTDYEHQLDLAFINDPEVDKNSVDFKNAEKRIQTREDEANWVLDRVGDSRADKTRAARYQAVSETRREYENALTNHIRENEPNWSDPSKEYQTRFQQIKDQFAKVRQGAKEVGSNLNVDAAEAQAIEQLQRSTSEKAKTADKLLNDFIGSVDSDGPGRAIFARQELARLYPDSVFSTWFKDDATVVEVLNAREKGEINDKTDLEGWLNTTVPTTKATGESKTETAPKPQGMMTTGQRLDAFRMAEDNLESADEPTKKEFGRLKEDIQFWNGVISDKEASEQDKAEAAQRLPDLENALLEIATGGVSSQSTNQNEQNQAANQSTIPAQEVPATSAESEGAGAGGPQPTIRVKTMEGEEVDQTENDYIGESRGIVRALESGEMTPEAALQNVEAVRMEIEAAPELTPEQKTQWFAPFQNIPAIIEQRGANSPAASSAPNAESTLVAPESTGSPGLISGEGSVSTQPAPARMNGISGDVVRTETGETVFRNATDGTETVLRVKEDSIEKDPAALTVDDFEGGDGTPLISEAAKEFSVLPENDRPVRPFFRSEAQPQSQDGQVAKLPGSYPGDAGSTPAPATPAPDIAAISADVQANPDIHRFKDGNRKLVSREAAVTILSQLPENLTNKDVATLAKDSGMTSTNFRKLVALRGDQNAVGSLLNGGMDAELGLFDDMLLNMRRERFAAKVSLNDTTPAAKVSNDANTESTVVGQSSVDRWVNDSFTAIEQAAAELPQSSINAALFREKLSTDEGRAEVREKLGQMFNTVSRNLKISDPVVREEAMEKIFRGALQKQTGEGLTSNVLEDLLTNLQKTGDPFLVKSKGGEVGYSAWLKHRNKQNEFMQAQGKRDMTETLVENEGAPTSASQGVQEEEGEGTGPAFTESDPDIEAGRAEARSMIREATQRTYERISREIAKQYGLDWESVRVAIAKHSEKTKGIKQDFDGLGWVVPQSAKIKKATDALEAAMPAIEQRLVSEMKVALRTTATLAENLGLLKSDAVEISGTPTLDQIIALGVIDEIKNPDFYNAINEARESKSTDSLMPLLANFDENAIASLQTVTGIVLNDGKQLTDKKQLASLNKADMQAVLDSDLLPVRLRQTLQTLVDLSGEDGLGLVRNSKNEGFRRLAELYSEQIGNRAPVEVVFNLGLNPSVTGQGLWSTGSNRVHISPFLTREKGLMEATILHEVMHPIWDSKINNYLRGNTTGLNDKELAAITELERLFSFSKAEAQKRLDAITDPDERRIMERNLLGTTNLREFLNEALNHRPFQEFLSELKDPNADGKNSVFRTILNKILELIRGGKVSLDSVLQRAFELSTDIASSNKPLSMEQRTPSQAEYIGEQETLKGRPLTEEEVSLAAVNYAMQNPRPRFAESQAQADQFAAEYLSDEELDAYNYDRQRDGQPVLSSDIVVSDQQIFEAIKANGGITIDVWTAGQPGTGIVVAPFKETETKIPLNTFAPQDVNDFMEKFRPLLEVPGMHLGGWVSDDTVYLDVSIVTEDEVTATILAEDGNQLAVYNIGTGEFPSTPELVARNSGALAERRKSPDIENLARSLQQAFGRAVGGIQSADNRNVPTEGALPELGILEPLTGQPLSETELESFKVMPMSWSLPPSNRRGDLLLNGLIAGKGKPIGAFRPAFDSEGNFIEGSMPEGDNVEFRNLNAPLGGGNEYLTKAQMSELINARGNDDRFWSRNSFEARRLSGGEELASKAVFPAPDEKFAGYTQIVDYIEGEYGPKAKALKSWINDSVVAYTASYVSNGNHGQHYIQYNPLTMLSYTRGQVDAVMREEMIHAASGFVLMKKGIGYSEFYEDLGKSLSSAQRSKLKAVYRSTNGMRSVGAEYFRAAIQKLLYGTITEAEMQETPMKKIVALLRDFVSYFRRKLVDPVVRDVYEDTVRILQKIDKKNAQQDPELGVLSSVSVSYRDAVDKSLSKVIDKAVAEPAQTAFLKPEEFNKAAQSLAVLLKNPDSANVKARGGRAVNLNSPDDSTARKLEKATGERWDRRLLDARVIHALTESDRTTPSANKIASAPMVPQTLRQADFVARTDFEGRPFLVFAKLYNDPESPTGVRWHFVEAREDTGAFETQYSTTDTQRGRAMAAKIIGVGDATPKKKKAPTGEVGYAQELSGDSSSKPQGIEPDSSSGQSEVLDNTNVESVQNKILEEITNLTDKQNRLAQSGNFDGAKLVGDQINELTAQFDQLLSAPVSGPEAILSTIDRVLDLPERPEAVETSSFEGGKVRSIAKIFAKSLGAKNRIEFGDVEGKRAIAKISKAGDRIFEVLRRAAYEFPNFASWYESRLKMALQIFTELDSDVANKNNQSALLVTLAITSNGADVATQTEDAWDVYKFWKQSGKLAGAPEKRGAMRGGEVEEKLALADTLAQKIGGYEKLGEFLNRKGTVAELRSALQNELGLTKKEAEKITNGELVDEVVPFSLIFGAKLGSFFNNMSGDFSTITMDRWFMRTFGRAMGSQLSTIAKENIEAKKARLENALKEYKAELLKNAGIEDGDADPEKTAAALSQSILKKAGVREGTKDLVKVSVALADYFVATENREGLSEKAHEIRRAANALFKIGDGLELNEAPDGGSHRRWIRAVMTDAINKFNQQTDKPLVPAEAQALLWYYEKLIHETYGSRQKDASPDYGSGANRLYIRERGTQSPSYRDSDGIKRRSGGGRSAAFGGDQALSTADESQEDAVIQSAPVAPFQGNVVPGFNPSVYTPASSRNTEALKRVLSDPNYTSVRLALTDKRYFAWTEKETLKKANEFIDALKGDLESAYNKSATTYGITPEQTILIRGLAMKRAQSAANVARAEMAKQNTPAARRTDLQFIAQHYSDMAETFAEDLMETASLAGQELRAFRLLADTLSPQSWVKTYKRAATRAQQRKFQKDDVLREMMDRIKEARRIAASSTTVRMQKALDFAAKRFLPEGASDEEIKAHTDFARVMANQLPVRDAVVQAAVEQTVIDGLETIRRSVAPEEQVPESFLREWENRLRSIASEQINAIIEERLTGGQVDAEAAPELSDNEKEAMREQKITDAWREFSDFPISEIVFSLAKATIVASDSPYANLVRRAQFDPTRIKKLREAVKLSIDTSNEIQMSVGDRRMTVDSLKLRLSEANPNLNEAQLAKLSEAVEAVYNEEVGKATRLALDGIIRKHAEKQTAKKIAKDDDFTSRLLPLVNMGAFSDEAAYNAIAERLRLPAWNPDTAAEIEAKARALQEFPEDSIQRQEASVQLMSDILKANVKEARGMQNFGPLMQIASALWSAGILSAPPTQIVNASMTTASVFLQSFTEASGYWVAATRKGATQEQARAYFGDMARAWVFAFGKDANNTSLRAVNEAFAALTKGQTKFKSEKLESLSPLEMFKFDPRVAIPGNKMMEAIISGEGKTAIKEAAKMAIGVPMVMAQRVFSLDAKGAVKDYMATLKLVGRFMLAADSMNSYGAAVTKQMMMRRYLAQEEGMSPQEIDKVMREAREGGNEAVRDAAMTQVETEAQRGDFGPAGSKTLEVAKARRIEQLIENQTYGTETINAGRDFAATATFNNEPYGVVGFLMDTIFGNTTKVLGLLTKPINPFPKTMSNLINAAIDYTPYGSVRAMGWNLGAGLANNSRFKPYVKEAPERGTPEYYALHSRAAAGTAAMGIIYMMVMSAVKDREEGKEPWFEIHGPGPGDPKARKQFRESGAKAFSLRMGDLVINYTDWPGLNIALAAFGTLYDQLVYSDAEMETSEWFMQTARAIVGTTLNRSALGGASALFNALATSTSSTVFENAVKGLGASYVTGFTRPSFVRWAETMATGQRQETRTDAGWLLSMAPVVSVFRDRPALNLLGEPIETSKWDATAGRVVTTQETHPVLTPLTNANLWINPPEVYKTYDPSKPAMVRDITQAEFYDYSKAYGETLSGMLTPKQAEYLAEMSKTAPNAAQETLNGFTRMAADIAKAKMGERGLSKGKEIKGP